MSMSTADRQMIQLAIVFVCLISSSFEAKTKSGAQLRTQQSLADSAICGNDEKVALEEMIFGCAVKKWHDLVLDEDKCCYMMNYICAEAKYIREKCTLKSDFDQKVKDTRSAAIALCANDGIAWSESVCYFGQTITGDCQQYETYLDCKDISDGGSPVNPAKESEKSSGLSLRYPAVTDILLVALLIKYFI